MKKVTGWSLGDSPFWPRFRIKWLPDGGVDFVPLNDEAVDRLRMRKEIERWQQKPRK